MNNNMVSKQNLSWNIYYLYVHYSYSKFAVVYEKEDLKMLFFKKKVLKMLANFLVKGIASPETTYQLYIILIVFSLRLGVRNRSS